MKMKGFPIFNYILTGYCSKMKQNCPTEMLGYPILNFELKNGPADPIRPHICFCCSSSYRFSVGIAVHVLGYKRITKIVFRLGVIMDELERGFPQMPMDVNRHRRSPSDKKERNPEAEMPNYLYLTCTLP